MEIRNKRLSDDEFFWERKEVLAEWPMCHGIDLHEAIEYHKGQSPDKNYVLKLAKAKRNGDTLIHSFNGTPIIEWQIKLVRHVLEEAGAA